MAFILDFINVKTHLKNKLSDKWEEDLGEKKKQHEWLCLRQKSCWNVKFEHGP